MNFLDTAVGAGMGMLLNPIQNHQQAEQQKRLQKIQIQGQKEMAEHNREIAMKMWNDTNFGPQTKQLQKAGLGIGLFYGGKGSGGVTTNSNPGNVSGANAERPQDIGMGMQLALQSSLQKAQIENIQADTEKKQVEANKLAGIDTKEAEARITNAEWEAKLKQIEATIKDETTQEIIGQIRTASEALIGEAKSKMATGNLDQAAYKNRLLQIEQTTILQQLEMSAKKMGLKLDQKNIEKIASEIANISHNQRMDWNKWEQAEKERWIKEKTAEIQQQMADFQTGGPAQAKQFGEAISAIIKAATLR